MSKRAEGKKGWGKSQTLNWLMRFEKAEFSWFCCIILTKLWNEIPDKFMHEYALILLISNKEERKLHNCDYICQYCHYKRSWQASCSIKKVQCIFIHFAMSPSFS
jgi:hypothetical protein